MGVFGVSIEVLEIARLDLGEGVKMGKATRRESRLGVVDPGLELYLNGSERMDFWVPGHAFL